MTEEALDLIKKSISSRLHVYLPRLDYSATLKISPERSDSEKKSDSKSVMSRDKIMYKTIRHLSNNADCNLIYVSGTFSSEFDDIG